MALSFLGIGTTRSGTTLLHEHLRAHPRVWLPPEKEIQYLNFQGPQGRWNSRHLKHLVRFAPLLSKAVRGHQGVAAELRWQARYLFGRRTDAWFLSLYDGPAGLAIGQIEPTYATLPVEKIRALRALAPQVKLVYLMRNPIERAWSSVTKSTAKNKGRPMSRVPEADIFEKLHRSALEMSRYAEHLERWESVFPRDRFCFGFFEEIEEQPEALLERVQRFIGVEPLSAARLFEPVNDTRRFKVPIPPHVERYLAERLADSTRALERRFGGYTTRWMAHIERARTGGVAARPLAAQAP